MRSASRTGLRFRITWFSGFGMLLFRLTLSAKQHPELAEARGPRVLLGHHSERLRDPEQRERQSHLCILHGHPSSSGG